MSDTSAIKKGLAKGFLLDEVRFILVLILISSFVASSVPSYILSVGGIVFGGITLLYMLLERRVCKFFWAGILVSVAVLLYMYLPDVNTNGFGAEGSVTAIVLASLFNGYVSQKYFGGTDFFPSLFNRFSDRSMFILSENSGWAEKFCIVTSTDHLTLVDMISSTDRVCIYALFNPESGETSLIEMESKEALSQLANFDDIGRSFDDMPCSQCSNRDAYKIGLKPVHDERGIKNISRNRPEICESCIEDMLKLALEKEVISKSELYANLA